MTGEAAYMATEKSERIAKMLKIVVRILLKNVKNKISCLWVARWMGDVLITHWIVVQKVTWRETLSQFQLGFYTKAGTLRWEYFEDQRKNKVLEMSITDVIGSMDVRVRRKPALKFNNYRGTSSAL